MAFHSVLVVDDEESMRHLLTVILQDHGYETRAVSNGADALKEIAARDYDVVVTDMRMPQLDGMGLLKALPSPGPTVIVMSAYGDQDQAIEAMKAGAYDYISKPFRPDEVVLVLRKAEERERLKHETERLRGELERVVGGTRQLVGQSAPMQALMKTVKKVAEVKTTVLVTGESGTGKELVALAIHEMSPRAEMPFVAVNCGAIPEQLMESELFGHVKGAFTDAHRAKKGLFEEADGGTIFLDEVGELPLHLQVKLLRVLQESTVRRVGENRDQLLDVRVVAATVRDLGTEVGAGRFREDLFYRLNVLALKLPALRERKGDIPLLIEHFVKKHNARLGRRPQVSGLAEEALERMVGYGWPGNVRELENAIERAMVLSEGETIELEALPEKIVAGARPAPLAEALTPEGDLSLKRAARRIEEDFIRRALAKTGGNRTRAAELLEISHRALLYKMKDYGIS